MPFVTSHTTSYALTAATMVYLKSLGIPQVVRVNLSSGSPSQGAPIVLDQEKNYGGDQQWDWYPSGQIRSMANTDLCLAVDRIDASAASPVRAQPCRDNDDSMRWFKVRDERRLPGAVSDKSAETYVHLLSLVAI